MGTIQPSHFQGGIFPQHNAQINQSDFTCIPNYSYTQHSDPYYSSNYTVLSHRQRPMLQLQRYELFFNTYQQYRTYEQVYNWRNRSRYLVQARAIKQKPTNRLCGTFHQATLFIQRVPIRACEITDIPIDEGLYMLYTSILGFRKIYERTGYFDISLDMICVNKDALVKVWLNSNLSKIYPELYSINQNLTQTDFISKILAICEPLIDFDPVRQKFTEFLKCCYFATDVTPRNQDNGVNNKFCSYSKIKQSSLSDEQITATKKSSQNAVVVQTTLQQHVLTFDKIIEYFEGYLAKYNLVIAREMKSIRDVFKIQQKIYHPNHDDRPLSTKLKQSKQTTSNNNKHKLQPLKFMNDGDGDSSVHHRHQNTRRKSSKWMKYDRIKTDRSGGEDEDGGMMTHKSEEYMRKIQQCKKQAEMAAKRLPSVSFGYHPMVRNNCQQLLSPQHVTPNHQQRLYLHGRQRVRTTVGPSVSFTICNNQSKNIKTSLHSPNKSYMPSEKCFYKNKGGLEFVEQAVGMGLNGDVERNGVLLVESRVGGGGQGVRRKTVGETGKGQLYKQGQGLRQGGSEDRKRTIWYTVQQERYLDEDIAHDMDLFEKLRHSE